MAQNYNKFSEKALLLLIFSFLEKGIREGKIGINKEYGTIKKDNMLLLFNIYKKLQKTSKSFANFKTQNYLIKRIENHTRYSVDIIYLAILLLYFYRISDIKRTITPLSVKEAKSLLEAIKDDLNEDEIIVAKNFFLALYPEKEEMIEFIGARIKEKTF